MNKVLDIYTDNGLKLKMNLTLSSLGEPTLYIHADVSICLSAVCGDITLVTYDSLPNAAFLEMPGCTIAFNPEFYGEVEALLAEAEGMKSDTINRV